MSGPALAALIVAGLIAAVDWIAVARGDERTERIAKPATLAALIVAAALSDTASSPTGLLLLAALAASLAGDWLLLPPVRFTGGLVAFLAAHLAYLALFLLGDLQVGPAALGVVATAILLATAGRPILAGAARAGMGGPVIAYFAAICLMAIAATASGSVLAGIGAWLFVISAALLGWDRFAAHPAATRGAAVRRRLAVIVTYHAAQMLLTIAVLRGVVA